MTTTTQAQPVVRQLLNNDETADELGISRRTLPVWRVQGKGPQFIKIGKLVRYERTELDAWIRANTHSNTSRNGAQSYSEQGIHRTCANPSIRKAFQAVPSAPASCCN